MRESDAELTQKVKRRFAALARSPEKPQKSPYGPESAKSLGYDAAEIEGLPASVTESFAGVGNVFSLGDIQAGETVLDLGCGAGVDSILAARRVGATGKIIAIDMTPEMIDKATRNAVSVGMTNIEFREGDADALPLADDSIDVVITNGVLNLCPDKPRVLAEMFRVLRPGGRLQVADILLHDNVTADEISQRGAWSD